jgi:hypothetical protein
VRNASEPVAHHYNPVHRWLLVALCAFVGLTAFGGGLALLEAPDGSLLRFPPDTLAHSPFTTFLVPGLALAILVGLLNVLAAGLVAQRSPHSAVVAFAGGSSLLIWIITEAAMLQTINALQIAYLVIALAIMGFAFARWSATRVAGVRASDKSAT